MFYYFQMTILEMENKRLFVGNLFPEVTSEDLENKFSRYHTLFNNNHSINYCHCMERLTITIPSTSPFMSLFVQFIFIMVAFYNSLTRFGSISKVEIKTKKDIDGNVAQTFAFVDISCGESGVSQCIAAIANKK